jgi:YYY domain-containing protein
MEWAFVVAYLLALAVFAALGAPIAAMFFRDLPRAGAAFALPAALAPFTIVVFWIGQFTFGLHTLALGVAVVLAGSAAALRVGSVPEWRAVASMYGVFAVGFLVMVVFRAASPGLTPVGGEQFLHFGLVNALERANSLPPEDMWFAGEPLRYYYGTQLQVTGLSMLTGTPVRYGFNLGIATFYGLLFVVAYGLGGAIVHRRGYPRRLGGVFAAFFVALAGPTTTAVRLATPHLPDAIAGPVSRAAFGFVASRFNGGDLARTVAELSAPGEWYWWYTRYVVPGTIQEVPLYSFVKADLHGHTFANGYVLFAGALAFAYYVTPAADRRLRAAILFGGLGSIAGLFGFMNTWSLPTVAGLTVLTVALADPHPETLLPAAWRERLALPVSDAGDRPRLLGELRRLILACVAGGVVLLIGVAIASPFLVFGHVPSNDGIGFFPPRSPLGPFLVIYGGLVAVFGLYVATRGRPAIADVPFRWVSGGALALLAAVAATILVLDFAVLAVLGPPILAGWILVRSGRGDFAVVLLIAGTGLLLSFEVVHARLPLIPQPRWNTSLKVAVQGWTLAAAGAGAAIAVLLARSAERLTPRSQSPRPTAADSASNGGSTTDRARAPTLRAAGTIALVAMVLLASAVFPAMVYTVEVGSKLDDSRYDSSLDGLAYVEAFHPQEYDALRWLDERSGHPTVVEAPGDPYGWTSPAATYSGLPGVIGWDHQEEYRSTEAYERRVTHVDEIYTGEWDVAAAHLVRYDVTYVYVGPNEIERYGEDARSFDREAFSVAFEGGNVTIYEVDHDALSVPGRES